jgi:RNA 3'-terminal phosphate cyclase
MKLERHGFYPQGGGEWQAIIKPASTLKPFNLTTAGELVEKKLCRH